MITPPSPIGADEAAVAAAREEEDAVPVFQAAAAAASGGDERGTPVLFIVPCSIRDLHVTKARQQPWSCNMAGEEGVIFASVGWAEKEIRLWTVLNFPQADGGSHWRSRRGSGGSSADWAEPNGSEEQYSGVSVSNEDDGDDGGSGSSGDDDSDSNGSGSNGGDGRGASENENEDEFPQTADARYGVASSLLRGHETAICQLARCGADGRGWLASASSGGPRSDVRVWALSFHEGSRHRRHRNRRLYHRRQLWQPQGQLLCVVATGRAAHESITSLAAVGPRLVVGLASGGVRASAVPSGFGLLTPPEPSAGSSGDRVLCVEITGSLVAMGHAHGSVSLFDCGDGGGDGASVTGRGGGGLEESCTAELGCLHFRAHPGAVRSLRWLDTFGRGAQNGKGLLLVTMADMVVRLWSVDTVLEADNPDEPAPAPTATVAADDCKRGPRLLSHVQ
eukprot:COSAG05_NODE_2388_length_3130_cov_3.713956_2_plen_450_part_00